MKRDRNNLKFSVLACGLLMALVFVAGCSESDAQGDDDRPTVVATTTMIEDLARVIGGEEVNVIGLMKTGEDPHLYDVKPKDATRIKDADLVLMNGLHLASVRSVSSGANRRRSSSVRHN